MKKYLIYLAGAMLFLTTSCLPEDSENETFAPDGPYSQNVGFDEGGDDEDEPKKDKQHW